MDTAQTISTSATATTAARATASSRAWHDYYELTKPRMNFLVVLTTMVGFYMASRGALNWMLLLPTLIGTALTASGASVLNQLIERRYDALMPRTRSRPVAAGRIQPVDAGVFGMALAVAGVVMLSFSVNLLTAILGAFTLLSYVFVYTPLKRHTTLNTVIGAVPGAIPPVMGFTAVQNALSPEALALFAILFFWQMPHFLAIAILYRRDYALAGFKMLPVVDEDLEVTGRQIILYAVALVPVSLMPVLVGSAGLTYFGIALMLGLTFLSFCVSCATSRTLLDARRLFIASIIYLPVLLAVLMTNRL